MQSRFPCEIITLFLDLFNYKTKQVAKKYALHLYNISYRFNLSSNCSWDVIAVHSFAWINTWRNHWTQYFDCVGNCHEIWKSLCRTSRQRSTYCDDRDACQKKRDDTNKEKSYKKKIRLQTYLSASKLFIHVIYLNTYRVCGITNVYIF